MKALGTVLAAGLLVLTACGDKSDEVPLDDLVPDTTAAAATATPAVDPNLEMADVDWDGWAPVYGELRPADDAAVAEISRRVTDLNASSWTVHESTTDSEISYTPEHVRMRSAHLDLHLDPREDVYDAVVTACNEDGCSELDDSDDVDTDAEALAGTVVGPYAILRMQLGLPEEVADPLDEGPSAISTVDSPAGPLDCLLVVERRRDLEALVGAPVAVDGYGRGHSFVPWCVDARGLVLLDNQEGRRLPLYDAWRPGVDADATALVPAPAVSEPPIDPTGAYEDAVWATWRPEYPALSPATPAVVGRLRTRVDELNQTSWTGEMANGAVTVAFAPHHVRVSAGGSIEWHMGTDVGPGLTYVACSDGTCLRVHGRAEFFAHAGSGPVGILTYWISDLTSVQVQAVSLERPMAFTSVASPVGQLDCLVRGTSMTDLLALEGTPMLEEEAPSKGGNAPVCIDQRGLVSRLTDDPDTSVLYDAWHEGVDEGFDTYPFPVRDYDDDPS